MVSRMKIVYIISDIDKALAFEWIALGLDARRFDLSFVLLNGGESQLEAFLRMHDIPVKRIVCRSKKDWPKAALQLIAHLRKLKPDVVHCHLQQANLLGLSAAWLLRIPRRIYTRHHSDYHFRYFPGGVKWDKLVNRLSTDIVAPSDGVKRVLTDYEHAPEAKITVINHGFDLAYFNEVPADRKAALRAEYNPSRKGPVVGVISRFTKLKGIQYIIPAFRRLLETHPDALLLLFNAAGDYQQEINAMLADLPEGSYRTVRFEAELNAVYSLFDVFLQVSTDTFIEAFGQTYVEALAAGVPSVFTLSGIAPDFIRDKENALVVPFEDEDAIHQAISTILADPLLRDKLKSNGWISVRERFSLHKMIKQLNNLYMK